MVKDITTARLTLRALTLEMVRAAQHDRPTMARLVTAALPDDWPPQEFASLLPILARIYERFPDAVGRARLIIQTAERTVIGEITMREMAPERWELGYALLPAYRRFGYAFEAAEAMVAWAFSHRRIQVVTAACDNDNRGSIRILEKLGMRQVAVEGHEIRWELRRPDGHLLGTNRALLCSTNIGEGASMPGLLDSEQLRTRTFGRTGLQITPICIGGGPLGDMASTFKYEVPEERALATIRAVFDSPIRFLDTAASYGDGESERRIGVVLREIGGLSAGMVLATKADRDPRTGEFSGEQMRRSVERSLRLLGMERFQLVYLHDPEYNTFEEGMAKGGPVEMLLKMKDEGVIDHVGVAGGPIDLMIRYVETGAFEALITHNRYTLINRAAAPLLDLAARRGLGVANAAPYGSGILAKGSAVYPRYHYHDAGPEQIDQVRQVEALCETYGVPLAAAALQFSLRDPRIDSTIVGISHPERVEQTLALACHPIPDDFWEQLDALLLGRPQSNGHFSDRNRNGP